MSVVFYAHPKKYRIPVNEEETKWETIIDNEPHKDFLQTLKTELKYQNTVIFNEISFDFDYKVLIFDEILLQNSEISKLPSEIEIKSILVVKDADFILKIADESEYLCIITESALNNWKKQKGIGIIGESYGFYGKKKFFDEHVYNKRLSEIYEYGDYCYFSGNGTENLVKLLIPYMISAKIA
jgi:hypothetical protein